MVIAPAIESFLALTLSSLSALKFVSVLERAKNTRQKFICCLLALVLAVLGACVEFNSTWAITYPKLESGLPIGGPIFGRGTINLDILTEAIINWTQAVALVDAVAFCIAGIAKRSWWRLIAVAVGAAFSAAVPQLIRCLIAFLRDANFFA